MHRKASEGRNSAVEEEAEEEEEQEKEKEEEERTRSERGGLRARPRYPGVEDELNIAVLRS